MRKRNSYWVFLDICKTYDNAWREGLWLKMRQCGVQEKFVRPCEGLFSEVEKRVVLSGRKSR